MPRIGKGPRLCKRKAKRKNGRLIANAVWTIRDGDREVATGIFAGEAERKPLKAAEDARNHARSLKGTPEFERSSNARKKVEMRFAHLKVQHGFERMRLRGLTGARDEFHLAAIVQNLKTMALRLLGPPTDGVCASIA